MRIQVVVQPGRPGIHQVLQPLRTLPVHRLQFVVIYKKPHSKIAIQLSLSLGLGQPPQRIQKIDFDPVEVILRLCKEHPEHGIRVGLAIYVWNSPVVPNYRDFVGRGFPGCNFLGSELGGRIIAAGSGNREDNNNEELFHAGWYFSVLDATVLHCRFPKYSLSNLYGHIPGVSYFRSYADIGHAGV